MVYFCPQSLDTGRWQPLILFSHTCCQHLLYWSFHLHRSSFPPTSQRVQWLFQMSNMVHSHLKLLWSFTPMHGQIMIEYSCLFVITVIDFCLARHLVCDQETSYQSLRLTWASKTNCNQRRGTGHYNAECQLHNVWIHPWPLTYYLSW